MTGSGTIAASIICYSISSKKSQLTERCELSTMDCENIQIPLEIQQLLTLIEAKPKYNTELLRSGTHELK